MFASKEHSSLFARCVSNVEKRFTTLMFINKFSPNYLCFHSVSYYASPVSYGCNLFMTLALYFTNLQL